MIAEDWEHGEGDTHLCGDCGEIVDGWKFHPECCYHYKVDPDTTEDGTTDIPGYGMCAECGSHVYLAPPEDPDSKPQWEVLE